MPATAQATQPVTPFQRVGGAAAVRTIVDRFYDLVDTELAYVELRAMHAQDLTPMRTSLAGFLNAWLGGPRDWFVEHDRCMMSIHSPLAIVNKTAEQWGDAMRRAIAETRMEDREIADAMTEALSRMAAGMVRRSA